MKMKSYPYTAALVAALFVSVGLASSTASAPADARNTRESELVVSFDEAFTGDSTIDGETTLAGAYNDKGSRHYDFTIRQSGNIAQVSGTITITTSHGTLISEFAGQLSATNNPTFIEAVETLTGGHRDLCACGRARCLQSECRLRDWEDRGYSPVQYH